MATKEEFDEYVKELERKIKYIQSSDLTDYQKEKLTDMYLEKLSIAYKFFYPDEDTE